MKPCSLIKLGILLSLFVLTACSGDGSGGSSTGSGSGGSSSVNSKAGLKIVFAGQQTSALPASVTKVTLTVLPTNGTNNPYYSYPIDITTTLTTTLTYLYDNESYTFTAEAFDSTGKILYRGSTTAVMLPEPAVNAVSIICTPYTAPTTGFTTAMLAGKTVTSPSTWNGSPSVNTRTFNADGTWTQTTALASAPGTVVATGTGTWSINASGQVVWIIKTATWSGAVLNVPSIMTLVSASSTGLVISHDGQTTVLTYQNSPTPPTVTLTAITVTPANPIISVGSTQQFTATGTYSDSSTRDLTTTVTWSSSSTPTATIAATGTATAVAAGTTTITATSGAVSGATMLTVTPPTPAEVLRSQLTPYKFFDIYVDGSNMYALASQITLNGITYTDPDGSKSTQQDLYILRIDSSGNITSAKFASALAVAAGTLSVETSNINVFMNQKTQNGTYAMDGNIYLISKNTLSMSSVSTLFTNANWGWFPKITVNGIEHFSYAGYFRYLNTTNLGSVQGSVMSSEYDAYRLSHSGNIIPASPTNTDAAVINNIISYLKLN